MTPPAQVRTHRGISYKPTSDILGRHEFGVSKNRKMTSTGGGRAWSEDEEIYLLQTRLQKLPYKHIAAHLKKTELACRLHYHQLSHGSSRRKRTTSISSGSSLGQSPVLPALNHALNRNSPSRVASSPRSAGSHELSPPDPIQPPRIIPGTSVSPRTPVRLPKPVEMTLSTSTASPALGPTAMTRSTRSSDTPSFPQRSRTPSLRLDCTLPPLSVDIKIPRLQAIYAAHKSSFWATIAADYGSDINPIVLEQAWKANLLAGESHMPITPTPSPDGRKDLHEKMRVGSIHEVDALLDEECCDGERSGVDA
ncbi:hypothetical protein GGS21DRAFT_548126 [Xylaria nigripes]|nr:hypothetical protein GGS21DRAFT_548126 [Xylaria nigripes]